MQSPKAEFAAPPENFDPFTASDETLSKYALPARPKNKEYLDDWVKAMNNVKNFKYIKPEFKVNEGIVNTTTAASSDTWSGYEVYGSTSISTVSGRWYVPSVSSSTQASDSSAWVGIGGDTINGLL